MVARKKLLAAVAVGALAWWFMLRKQGAEQRTIQGQGAANTAPAQDAAIFKVGNCQTGAC